MKIKDDVTAQMTEVQRLKEQLKDLKQEFMKQEQQLIEVKKNSTTLEKKLEYESLQCGRQIAELKGEYEDTKKSLEEETSKRKQVSIYVSDGIYVSVNQSMLWSVTEEIGKPGSDAGMPGIEDSEVGKIDEVQFALKKPAITQKHPDGPNVAAEPGLGAADGPGGQGLLLDQPRLQLDRAEGQAEGMGPQAIIKQPDKPVVFEENNKAGMKADELGERHRIWSAEKQKRSKPKKGM
uniref:Protein GOLM2 n=1 Tax=Oryzias sinensis TaxID=183150 RepID=A0A8C7Y696_9TELE